MVLLLLHPDPGMQTLPLTAIPWMSCVLIAHPCSCVVTLGAANTETHHMCLWGEVLVGHNCFLARVTTQQIPPLALHFQL